MESTPSALSPSRNPANSNNGQVLLSELGPYDVLLGRGTGPNENQGNVRFREIVKETMLCYQHDPLPSASNKSQIVHEVLGRVKALNGYFVRKLTKDELLRKCSLTGAMPKKSAKGGRKQSFCFVVVPDYAAVNKTKQSIRFQLAKVLKDEDYACKKITRAQVFTPAFRTGGRGKDPADPFLRRHGDGPSPSTSRGLSPRDPVLCRDHRSSKGSDAMGGGPTSNGTFDPAGQFPPRRERLLLQASHLTSKPSRAPERTCWVSHSSSFLAATASAADLLRTVTAPPVFLPPRRRSSNATACPPGLLAALMEEQQQCNIIQTAVLVRAQQEQRNASLLSSFFSLERGGGGTFSSPFGCQLPLLSHLLSTATATTTTTTTGSRFSDLDRTSLLMMVVQQQTEDVLRSRHLPC
jgi:hypothetical protein